MNIKIKSAAILFSLLLIACGGKEEKKTEEFSIERAKSNTEKPAEASATKSVKPSERIDLTNKGVGPITAVSLNAEVNKKMAAEGEAVYNQMCTACHRIGKKFIGPPPNDILKRRAPEWVMNMILNPEEMIKTDPLAKDLLQEFNGAPMAQQGLTEAQARAVLEYFRTL